MLKLIYCRIVKLYHKIKRVSCFVENKKSAEIFNFTTFYIRNRKKAESKIKIFDYLKKTIRIRKSKVNTYYMNIQSFKIKYCNTSIEIFYIIEKITYYA